MNVYSIENIEPILIRLLKNDNLNFLDAQDFKRIRNEIDSHEKQKKSYRKQLKQLRRELSKLEQDVSFASNQETTIKNELSIQIEELDIKINDENIVIEDFKNKWNEEIKKRAKEILIKIRAKKIVLKINDFLLFDKPTFTMGDISSKVLEQLIKEDISKHYKRKPADRNDIIEQLKGLIGNNLPKCIIRADIKSFFESVPMIKLLSKLEDEGYVSPITIGYLRLISKHVAAKGVDGVPRGLAFSSYLTEIHMQGIDDEIRNLSHLYFYQRYVDDMVLLFSVDKSIYPPYRRNVGFRQWKIVKEIFKKEELALHEEGKKKSIIYSGKTNKNEFDYLGYKFIINQGSLFVKLSDNRLNGYVHKVEAIFNHYNETARDNESITDEPKEYGTRRRKRQQPLKRLFGQLSALTGNGMLKGSKSNILTGIYYSNVHITCIDDFKALDKLLEHYITCHLEIPENLFKYNDDCSPEDTTLKIKEMMIQKWSFVDGFKTRRFCKNSSYFNRLKQIKNLCQ